MKNRGRPKKENARKIGYLLRINDEEKAMLDYLSGKLRQSKADVIRKGLKILYNLEKYRGN